MLQLPQIAAAGWIFSCVWLWFLIDWNSSKLLAPYIAGAVILILGAIRIGKDVANARGVGRVTLLGPMLLAIPMAVFGADHFIFAKAITPLVPSWIPGHLFWVLFVGAALVAGALSLALHKYAPLAAALFAIMLFFFIPLLWLPQTVRAPTNRFAWAYPLRDLAFGAGALSFAAAQAPERWTRPAKTVLTMARVVIGIALIFFGVEHFIHPKFAPGVPLEEPMPAWFPAAVALAYATGIVLLIVGVALLLDKRTKLAATGLGLWLLLLVVVYYVPVVIAKPLALANGLDYLANTLMFSGSVLCLAESYHGKPTTDETDRNSESGLTLTANTGTKSST